MRHAGRVCLFGLALFGAGLYPLAAGPAVLTGTVRDGNHHALRGVRVQVFVDGFPSSTILSDSLGGYRLVFPWAEGADSTVVAWWTPEDSRLVPAVAVLHESTTARNLGLWDAEIPRVAVPAESVFDPVLKNRSGMGTALVSGAGSDSAAVPGSGATPEPEAAPDAGH